MITLPKEFTAIIKYPGYFWNIDSQTLWSIKINGVLKELKASNLSFSTSFRRFDKGYFISHKGLRRFISLDSLKRTTYKDSVIPVKKERSKK